MIELNENLTELIAMSPALILQFGSEDCNPCHAIRHRLEMWLEERPEVEARYVDITSHLAECAQMGIFSAPTVMMFMDGQMIARESGYFSLDEMLSHMERSLKLRE